MRTPIFFLVFFAAQVTTTVVSAQTGPHIGYVHPAGGRQGKSFEVTVGGQRLRGLADAFVSGAGVRAKVKSYDPPMTQREFNAMREEATKLQRKRNATRTRGTRGRGTRGTQPPVKSGEKWTTEDQQRLAEIQRKLVDRNRRREIPAIAELAVLQVTIAPDTPPGRRGLRLLTASGLTNPLVFCIGELPEFTEQEASRNRASRRGRSGSPRLGGRLVQGQSSDVTRIQIPAVANGQILPGDVDRFRFRATKGQKLVAAVSARALIPYLADAVPGWFQATIALKDAGGNELAHVDDYRFHPDPVLVCDIPADGDYVVEIRDALYRGREDFVYRIAVGELPFVTSVFPLGGSVGAAARVEVRGINLTSQKISLAARDETGIASIRARGNELTSNALPFAWDDLPESLEREPNQEVATAQDIALPRIVNGRIDRPGDVDVFRFDGRYGQQLVAEVHARRLRSPVDSLLTLNDESGRQVARSDDSVDTAAGLTTHHADSLLRVKLPRTGTYFLHLSDAQRKGGPEYGYRLRVGAARPDFDLRIVPSCIGTRAGATVALTVRAVRRDGFAGKIALALSGAPKGFELGGAVIQAGEDRVRITMTVPGEATGGLFDRPVVLRIVGRARVGGGEITRSAVAADDVMQAFLYRHLVAATELLVSVRGRSGLPIRTRRDKPVLLPVGGTARLKLPLTSRWANRWIAKNKVQLVLDAPPPGIAIQKVTQSDGGFEITLRTDSKKVTSGTAGNLIFSVFATPVQRQQNKKKPARRARRRALGMLAAVPYRVAKRKGGRL